MRRAPAIVRRLLPHRLALAAAALTVVLAATLLAALAAFSATVSSHAVRTSLTGNPGTTISVNATVDSAATVPAVGGKLRTSLSSALGGVPVTVWGAASSDYLDLPRGIGLANAQTHLISLTALYAHAALVAGSWPTVVSGSAAVPAAVPAGLARSLHLAAGQTVRLHESVTGAPVDVRITGIFRPLQPGSPYWLLGSASGGVQQVGRVRRLRAAGDQPGGDDRRACPRRRRRLGGRARRGQARRRRTCRPLPAGCSPP